MPRQIIKGTQDKGLQRDTNRELARVTKREEVFQKINQPRRDNLSQAETKAEIEKQKARNAYLQKRRGRPVPQKINPLKRG